MDAVKFILETERMCKAYVPATCVNHLGYEVNCTGNCRNCWNRPLSEVEQK